MTITFIFDDFYELDVILAVQSSTSPLFKGPNLDEKRVGRIPVLLLKF